MRSSRHRRPPDLDPVFAAESERTSVRACDHPGCAAAGEYRAPKSRNALSDYYWFCLDHVREYNRSWNYYAGMNEDEVETMLRHDTIWQRRTWPFGSWAEREARLREAVDREFDLGGADGRRRGRNGGEDGADAHAGGRGRENRARNRPRTEEERALAVLDLEAPVDFATVKARYKTLVKRHHPDANGGDRAAEEKLKAINQAYGVLRAGLAR
ncbi:MAG: J domain-containing protein [Azospirillaceae bacterium]